jgi:hypothetical protein
MLQFGFTVAKKEVPSIWNIRPGTKTWELLICLEHNLSLRERFSQKVWNSSPPPSSRETQVTVALLGLQSVIWLQKTCIFMCVLCVHVRPIFIS